MTASETWMRQFANRCRKELNLPPFAMMTSEDFQKAGSLFTREYLAQPNAQWAFPDGEEGIENMQTLIVEALFFLNDDQAPTPAIANEFVRHAMHAQRKYLATPEKPESMDPSIDALAQVFADRVREPGNATLRTRYFNTISAFGARVAPNVAFEAFAKAPQFHQYINILMMKIDQAAKKKCGQGLDDATKNRIHTALLVGLENMRQNQPAEAAPDHSQVVKDFTKKIRGKLDFPRQFPTEERPS